MNQEQMQSVLRAKQYNLLMASRRFVRSDLPFMSNIHDSNLFKDLKEAVEALDGGANADV